MTATGDWIDNLPDVGGELERSSTAERVADLLRGHIIDGVLAPGARLSEERIGKKFRVSRNTLREAFRLLGHERLLVHEFNRGVFVAKPDAADVVDLFRVRRTVELGAVRAGADAPPEAVAAIGAAVEQGERARERGDWEGIGTANMAFHRAVSGLVGSPRIDEMMRQILAELRLVFHVMAAPRDFYEPYLDRNRAIYELMAAGAFDTAAAELSGYFDIAERQLLDAFTAPAKRG
ncbi:GntR family transcriptional regulator [Streptomonospora nanhaiensis]|uniref:DNA-binding GntR family transcriptional regulator n=1 Tax=Streptomonospora nanhaiensis TaxID=1323731 RepID=A0A853BGT3_9ACTN|nr:GntR family transcriptional regulator [Streptomonospora nanhaiensis]MBV2364746.1 GntR family transcriptional regulator [Streptomonospora nanhaiensis]MBX9391327.1 GntR family transcriptional regulator [Streptomonospora nanhaiensis]NYI93757.1 DNA-binding GntR family transcriptional regulator [Streptomonospora nanhaiensis]